ncbi:MAG: L-threonylcarbamoyladenylate synthase [Nitrosopumilus sp.]|nr:L-threonylcarbamoyladenylate synthase [Nitrosopumilus sp.]
MKVNCNKEGILKASKIIKNGGVIIFPTDTVYGIGCDPYNKSAVEKIYKIKSRQKTKPLPVLVYSKEIASKIVSFDKESERLAEKFWPGPLTLILKLINKKLKNSLNLDDKIALRVPENSCTLELLKRCSLIVGTSANISGQESFTNPLKCYENMKGFDLFLDGGEILGIPSTIVEVVNGELKIHREGTLTKKEIMKIL